MVDDLTDLEFIKGFTFQEEWVIATLEIVPEFAKRLDVLADRTGNVLVIGKDLLQRISRIFLAVDKVDVFPQGESMQVENDRTAGKVRFLIRNLEEARTGKDNSQTGKRIIDRLYVHRPVWILVDLIHQQDFSPKLMKLAGKLEKVMSLEEWAINGDVKGSITRPILLPDILEHQSRLSGAPCPQDADTAFIPVNPVVNIPFGLAYRLDEPLLFPE
jgi:hypothetical protein